MKRSSLIEAILLCLILALAFYMALWPRLDYPFPMHVDEWMHLGHTLQITETGHLDYPNPFLGGRPTVEGHPETGYYLWLNALLFSTGLPWLTLARLMPAIVLAIMAFAAYAWGRKQGVGLEAALFVTFIHTTIRFLGPAFLVPVTLGLVLFPMCLMLISKLEQDWRPLSLIMLSLATLFLIHATTAAGLGLVLVVYLTLCLILYRGPIRERLPVLTCLLLIPASALAIFLWNRPLVIKQIGYILGETDLPMPAIWYPLPYLGYVMLVLVVLGAGFLVARGGWRNYSLLISVAILLFFVQLYRYWIDIGPHILYERGWLYVMLLMALIAGYGLGRLRHLSLEFFSGRRWAKPLIYLGLGLVVAFALIQRLDAYKSEHYYYPMDVQTYHDFVFVGEKLDQSSNAVMDPYLAWTFVPITGKYVFVARAAPWGVEEAAEIRDFLKDGAVDTRWLTTKRIDLIYSPYPLKNPDLVEVRDKVYILREEGD